MFLVREGEDIARNAKVAKQSKLKVAVQFDGFGNAISLTPTPTPIAQKRRVWGPRDSQALPIHAKNRVRMGTRKRW